MKSSLCKKNTSYLENRLREKENTLAQIERIEAQATRGTGYEVGDVVRIRLDSTEVKKKRKKMARIYSGKYKVTQVLKGG